MEADLLELANEHPTALGFETAALELLRKSVGYDVAFLSREGLEEAPTVVGLGPELVARAHRERARYYRELLPVKRAALQGRGVAVDTRVLGESAVRKAAYHREMARPVGGRHSLLAYVPFRGRIVAALMLGRCGSEFSDRAMASVESVLPALGVTLAAYGLPVAPAPLLPPPPRGLLRRLGLARGSRVLAERGIPGATIQVRDHQGFREMLARDGTSELIWTRASLRDASESGWPYIELLHLAAIVAKSRRRALFVGCGGAVALRQFSMLYPGLAIDLVEREGSVVELARAWYGLDRIPGVTVNVADGAEFAARAPASTWDIVVIDAFDASDSTATLKQPAFFAALHRVLRPGGALAINVIGTLDGRGPVREITGHLSHGFRRIRVVPVMVADEEYSPDALRNVVLIASRGE